MELAERPIGDINLPMVKSSPGGEDRGEGELKTNSPALRGLFKK
jgi:hypothetical protein